MNQSWWNEVDAIISEKSLLKHPFYQAWTKGELTRGDLALYARQYYKQESRFPLFVEAAFQASKDDAVKKALSENLRDELGSASAPSHPELWLRFAETVGASRESVKGAEALPQTQACVSAFEALCASETSGLAALYAYEAQQPAVAATKIEGLKARYGLDSEAALSFFQVHQTADEWHSAEEKNALLRAVEEGRATASEVKESVSKACDALNTLLDGVWEKSEAKLTCACA